MEPTLSQTKEACKTRGSVCPALQGTSAGTPDIRAQQIGYPLTADTGSSTQVGHRQKHPQPARKADISTDPGVNYAPHYQEARLYQVAEWLRFTEQPRLGLNMHECSFII